MNIALFLKILAWPWAIYWTLMFLMSIIIVCFNLYDYGLDGIKYKEWGPRQPFMKEAYLALIGYALIISFYY